MDPILEACRQVGIVGTRFCEDVSAQVESAVVARRGRDAVRLTGDTGSGKEMVSSLVHRVARDQLGRTGDLVELNCGNLPDTLFESSLFGHRRGAFTGASDDRVGLLDRAKGGTLVLDEVQNLTREAQGRLLRLVGEREYRPVGSTELKRTDALILMLSNVDLVQLSAQGGFRRDLVDRAPAKITLAPLWQRREDIAELAQSFAAEAARDREWPDFEGLTRRAMADIEGAVVASQEGSVRRMRELVRDAVFSVRDPVPMLESSALVPFLTGLLPPGEIDRAAWDRQDIEERFDLAVEAQVVRDISKLHGIPENTLLKLTRVLREIRGTFDEGGVPGSYRNLMARTGVATKAALWLLSGATNQGEFRRYFGNKVHEMPPKSVAWQLYHDLFGEGPSKKKEELS